MCMYVCGCVHVGSQLCVSVCVCVRVCVGVCLFFGILMQIASGNPWIASVDALLVPLLVKI